MTKQIKLKKPQLKKSFLIGMGVFAVLAITIISYTFFYADRYLPHTQIAGVEIGGLNRSDAEAAIQTKVQSFLDTPQKITYEDKSWDFAPKDLGMSFSVNSALDTVWNNQKDGISNQLLQLGKAPFSKTSEMLAYTLQTDAGKDAFAKAVLKEIEQPYHETELKIENQKVSIVAGRAGKRLDLQNFESNLLAAFSNNATKTSIRLESFEPEVTVAMAEEARVQAALILEQGWQVTAQNQTLQIDPKVVGSWITTTVARDGSGNPKGLELALVDKNIDQSIQDWRAQVDQKPLNAKLKTEAGVVVIAEDSKDGLTINADQTKKKIRASVLGYTANAARTIAAPVEVSKPAVRRDTYQTLGLTKIIGTATTDFSGSPTNRKLNIALGQKNLNGSLINPGETYSTIDTIGPIEESAGFLAELVIKDNRTVPEAGGGLCQVSTTLFRAVLNAGLPVVERSNHSYRVGYYERGVGPGLDATIYSPKPDFRWKNDLSTPVYVASSLKGTTITFELYGTPDGRTSQISSPQILEETPSGEPIYTNTDTLPVGTQKQIETAHSGAKTAVTYVVTKDGKEINKQVFRSTYKPWPAQYLVGTKPVETPVTQ